MSNHWPNLGDTSTLSQRVYAAMRDRLLGGEFEPRAFIREVEVAQALGVSRTPVREALGHLASEGFLERIPRRGFRIPETSIHDLVHLYPVMSALEVLAGELAFQRISEEELGRLEEINEEFGKALREQAVDDAIALNERFHHVLAEASGNRVLCDILDDLRGQVRRLEVWDFEHYFARQDELSDEQVPFEWGVQHTDFLNAVRRGDSEGARLAISQNRVFAFRAEMERVLRGGGHPVTGNEVAPKQLP